MSYLTTSHREEIDSKMESLWRTLMKAERAAWATCDMVPFFGFDEATYDKFRSFKDRIEDLMVEAMEFADDFDPDKRLREDLDQL